MRTYDTTFVLDGRITPEEREALISRFSELLVKLGGTVDRIIRWGMRPLAYEINKRSRGYYVIFYHTSAPENIRPFEHDLGLSEYVLRYMTLVWDGVHPSYIHDEGQQAEAGELPPETEDVEDSGDDLDDDIDMSDDTDGLDDDDDEIDTDDESMDDTLDESEDTESAPEEDDTDESVKEAE